MKLVFIAILMAKCALALDYSYVIEVDKTGLELIITHKANEFWRLNDEVCVEKNSKIIACGVVINVNEVAAQVIITHTSQEEIVKGDFIIDKYPKERETAAKEEVVVEPTEAPTVINNISFGTHIFSPYFQYEFPALDKYSLGIAAIYDTGLIFSKIRGLGIFLSVFYYPYELYEKIFIELGGGLSRLNSLEDTTSPIFHIFFGWCSLMTKEIKYSVGIGVKHFINWDKIERNSSSLFPVFSFRLSYEFKL